MESSASTELDPRYPVGRFDSSVDIPHASRAALIDSVAAAPSRMREAISGLSEVQLDTPYRDGGWTVRQTVHHIADSHINAYARFRLALTEDNPTIKTYEEKEWAKLPDARSMPIEVSLQLLDALHERWVVLLRSLSDQDFSRTYNHPENGPLTLGKMLGMYEWHGRHHAAHVTNLRKRRGW